MVFPAASAHPDVPELVFGAVQRGRGQRVVWGRASSERCSAWREEHPRTPRRALIGSAA